jgi:hypothetical protein
MFMLFVVVRGDCFHFGFRFNGEGFMESIRRTEYFLSSRVGLKSGMHAVDVGCGVGGNNKSKAALLSKVDNSNTCAYVNKLMYFILS